MTDSNTAIEDRTIKQEEIKLVEDDLNDKAYATPVGFTTSIPPYDSNAKRELLKSYTETYVEPVDPDDARKKVIDIQPLLDIRDGYKLKTTARTIPGLINAIVKYEEHIKEGRFLVIVKGPLEEIEQAEHILHTEGTHLGLELLDK